MVLSSARSQAIDGSGRQVATEGQGTSQDLGAGPGGKQGPCTAEQVAAPKGGQRAARWQSYGPALLVAAPEPGGGRGMEGRQLVTFPPYGLAVAFSVCLGFSCLPATCAWPGCSHPGRSGPLW